MTRKISTAAAKAFWADQNFKLSNTKVVTDNKGTSKMYLHHNLIAQKSNGIIRVFCQGWQTQTTKERLNAVLQKTGYGISQQQGKWYIFSNYHNLQLPWKEGIELLYQEY